MVEGYTQLVADIKEEKYYKESFPYKVVFGDFR